MAKKQNKKNKMSNALVVYQKPPAQPQKQKKKKKKNSLVASVPPVVRQNADVRKYYLALCDPFSPEAEGARVPDMFSSHTITYTLRATHTIQANSSGNASVWIFPNLAFSLLLPEGGNSSFQTITWLDGTTNSQYYWGFDSTTLGNNIQDYRIVGMGVRVTNMSSMTNSQGKFIMGSYPTSFNAATRTFNVGGAVPAVNALGTRANTVTKWGIPNNAGTYVMSSLVNYPGTQVVSALTAGEKQFDIIPKLSSPAAMHFREANDSFQGFDWASGTAPGDASYLRVDGFETCFVSMQGGIANTSTYDLEVIYHIEGAPNIGAGTTDQTKSFVAQNGVPSPVNMSGFYSAVEGALKHPTVREALHVGADMIHPILGKVSRALF